MSDGSAARLRRRPGADDQRGNKSAASHDVVEKVIALRICTTVDEDGQETMRPVVRCPRSHEAIDAHQCAGCMRMRSLEWGPTTGGEVSCLVAPEPAVDPRADFGEVAARTQVFDVVAPVATCVTPGVSLSSARAIFERVRARALPVVDGDGKLAGILSRADLAARTAEGPLSETMTVRDVMTPCTHALPYEAPLPYAISLLAHEELGEVPVVKVDGTVVGVCHAVDILRWVASQLGYVPPRP